MEKNSGRNRLIRISLQIQGTKLFALQLAYRIGNRQPGQTNEKQNQPVQQNLQY